MGLPGLAGEGAPRRRGGFSPGETQLLKLIEAPGPYDWKTMRGAPAKVMFSKLKLKIQAHPDKYTEEEKKRFTNAKARRESESKLLMPWAKKGRRGARDVEGEREAGLAVDQGEPRGAPRGVRGVEGEREAGSEAGLAVDPNVSRLSTETPCRPVPPRI